MKILIATRIFPPMVGGAGAVFDSLARCLPDEIAILTETTVPSETTAAPETPFRVFRITPWHYSEPDRASRPMRLLKRWAHELALPLGASADDFLRVVDEYRPDVLVIGTVASAYWMVYLVRLRRPHIKVVFYVHGEEASHRHFPLYYRLGPVRMLQRAAHVVAVSRYTAALLREIGARGEVTVINNGVDPRRYTPGPPSETLRARWQLGDHKVLLTLARLDARKGQDMVIAALPEILRAVPDTVYVIAGDGDRRSELERRAGELGVSRNVIFAGHVAPSEMEAFYRSCDVYIMANRQMPDGDTEGFGLVFLEAGAAGRPVIGGQAGGVPDAILDGKTGLLVDGHSPASIAAACIRLLQDAELRSAFGRAGRAHAEAQSWSSKAAELRAMCARL